MGDVADTIGRSNDDESALDALCAEVRACRICADFLPLGPRPLFQTSSTARILIVGQAPGRVAHECGLPFADRSGDRLREWLGLSRDEFYDPARVALLPMGFCYPGSAERGDLAPRPECAPAWRAKLLALMAEPATTVLLGRFAQVAALGSSQSLTEVARAWRDRWPDQVVLPHPSPRNNRWMGANPWLKAEVLPALRERVRWLVTAAG